MNDVVSELKDYLKENYQVFKATSKRLQFDGVVATRSKLRDLFDLNKLASEGQLAAFLVSNDRDKRDLLSAVYDMLLLDTPYKKSEITTQSGSIVSTEHLMPATWLETGDKFIFDTQINKVAAISFKAFVGSLSREEQGEMGELVPYMQRDYDPYNIAPVKDVVVNGIPVTAVNTYEPPEWRLLDHKEFEEFGDEMPQIFEEFFVELFPNARVREYVYNWLRNAILFRNETILTINGVKGIGKGLFSAIAKGLVGKTNYTEAPVSALSSHFNAVLDNNRVIVFDEIEVDKKAHSKLKRYANREQNIEKKGFDALRAVETYNSLIITNNDTSDMYLEIDDRRFSVLDCTKTPLLALLGQEKLNRLATSVESEEVVGALGNWLIEHGKCSDYDEFSVWKGPTFYKLAYTSLAAWQKHIVDTCVDAEKDGEPIYYRTLKKKFKKDTNGNMPANMAKVEDFITNYYHLGEYRVADLDTEDGEYILIPNEEVLGKKITSKTVVTTEMLDCL